jgi:spore maturation protein A
MLNYIWGGLIAISLVFALGQDFYDLAADTFQNEQTYELEILPPENTPLGSKTNVWIKFADSEDSLRAIWRATEDERALMIKDTKNMPPMWQTHFQHTTDEGDPFRVSVLSIDEASQTAEILLPPVQFTKMSAISQAAFDMAEFSVELAIGLVGAMALWLGIMQIAEKSGLILIFVKIVRPALKWLFPDIPEDHPALGAVSLNLAANMLGLSNAATPMGIKAMEELQKLNPEKDTATDAMCMFLTMNTASVQLVPPVMLVAIIGVGIGELFFSILITTAISLTIGIIGAKWLARRHRIKAESQEA